MSNLSDPRVLFALERTALAWNRSSLALMAFGFLIEKSTLLAQLINANQYVHKIMYSRWLGVLVIVAGILLSIWSVIQYRVALRSLSEVEMVENYSIYPPIILNSFTCFAGVLLIISFWIH